MFWPNPEVCAWCRALKPRYRLLLLSNTNELHSRHFLRQFADTLAHSTAWCCRTRSACASPTRASTTLPAAGRAGRRRSACSSTICRPTSPRPRRAAGRASSTAAATTCGAQLAESGVGKSAQPAAQRGKRHRSYRRVEDRHEPHRAGRPRSLAGDRGRAPPPAARPGDDRLGELHQPRRPGRPGLGADQQVRRGLSRPALLRRLRVRGCGRAPGHRPRAASCSAPNTPTSSRTPAPRPTWPSTSPAWSRATRSWR